MAQATNSRGGRSKTQVQVESIRPAESQIGNPEVSSREKRRHRASLARHSRKCSVCHHKDREFIDADYLRWISPETLARQYKISHHSVVYRHADATGLRTQRRAALRATLEHFIEQAENVRVTAHSVVSAVRLYAQINDQGQYTLSVRRHIIEHHYVGLPAEAGIPDSKKSKTTATPIATISLQTNARASATPAAPVDFRNSNAAASQAATSAARSAAPFGESQDKFPAVPVASAARLQNVGSASKKTGSLPPAASAQREASAANAAKTAGAPSTAKI